MADDYTPEGYDSAADFLEEARERWQEGADADRENRDEGKTDLEFLAGDQWRREDVEARKGRPCLMINQLPQFIAQVIGDIRINKPGIKVRPAHDADKDLAEVREGLIRAIENDSDGQNVYADAALLQVACGIGNFQLVVEYAKNDVFERDIKIKRIANAFAVVWDPFLTEPSGKDARYCFVSDDMPRKVFEKTYPDQSPADLGSLSTELAKNGWLDKDTVRISQYWLLKERPAEIGMLEDGSVEWITKENEKQIVPHLARNSRGEVMRRKTVKQSVCMYLITGHAILEPAVEYQISRIPVFRVPGWELQTVGKKVRWGIVRFAKDPQRLKNYWRSVAAEKLALAPRQQWLVHENQDGEADEFHDAARSGDTVLRWKGQTAPQRLEPPPVEAALLQEAQMNAQDMKDVTGLHDASLGIQSNETSGKAIMARQREGDVATYIYTDNLNLAIAECGRVIDELIPEVMDTVREIRVLGADETQKVMRVNDPGDPDSVDLSKGKFDIVVETGPSFSTKRVEADEAMTALFQSAPQVFGVAADLFVRAKDIPYADAIADRIKRSLPPGITQDPNEPVTPEQQQQQQAAAQQQQMQMQIQMQGLQMEMGLKQAQMQEAQAKAALAAANAKKALAESQMPDPASFQQALAMKELDLNSALKLAQINAQFKTSVTVAQIKSEAEQFRANVDLTLQARDHAHEAAMGHAQATSQAAAADQAQEAAAEQAQQPAAKAKEPA